MTKLLFTRLPCGVPNHLPYMAIGILKVSGVSAPECLFCFLHNMCAGLSRLLHNCVYLIFAAHIVPNRKVRGTGW